MAILFGTTADGETLPVEVNEFGQLVAEGLNGPPGPPGPPGVGELPADPFEGAVLGWKDSALAWLGQTVPLPDNVFGPIISYENGLIVVEGTISLPFSTQLYMSGRDGGVAYFNYQSAPIVSSAPLSIGGEWSGGVGGACIDNNSPPKNMFNGQAKSNPSCRAREGCSGYIDLTLGTALPCNSVRVYMLARAGTTSPDGLLINGRNTENVDANGNNWGWITVSSPDNWAGGFQSLRMQPWPNGPEVSAWEIDGEILTDGIPYAGGIILEFEDSRDFQYTEVGDEVQPGVQILRIDASINSIAVSGGTWSVGEVVNGPIKTGTGSVQSTIQDALILREDNKMWLPGAYVANYAQKIASRYVLAEKKGVDDSFVQQSVETDTDTRYRLDTP